MSPVPLATSRITVTRVTLAQDVDGYDPNPPAPTTIATNVRAVISPPSATTKLSGGTRIDYTGQLRCDTTAIEPGDTLTDSVSGLVWTVLWVAQINALGQTFTRAEMKLTTGAT